MRDFIICAIRKVFHSKAHHTLIKELKDLNLHCRPENPIGSRWRKDEFDIGWRIRRCLVRCNSYRGISCHCDSFYSTLCCSTSSHCPSLRHESFSWTSNSFSIQFNFHFRLFKSFYLSTPRNYREIHWCFLIEKPLKTDWKCLNFLLGLK